LPKHPFPSRLG